MGSSQPARPEATDRLPFLLFPTGLQVMTPLTLVLALLSASRPPRGRPWHSGERCILILASQFLGLCNSMTFSFSSASHALAKIWDIDPTQRAPSLKIPLQTAMSCASASPVCLTGTSLPPFPHFSSSLSSVALEPLNSVTHSLAFCFHPTYTASHWTRTRGSYSIMNIDRQLLNKMSAPWIKCHIIGSTSWPNRVYSGKVTWFDTAKFYTIAYIYISKEETHIAHLDGCRKMYLIQLKMHTCFKKANS